MTDIGGDCLRCGQCEGYGCNCTTEEQQSAHIDHLIAAKDAQDAKIKALVKALENAMLHHYVALCVVRSNLDSSYSAMVDEMQAACDRWDAALAAAKETT